MYSKLRKIDCVKPWLQMSVFLKYAFKNMLTIQEV